MQLDNLTRELAWMRQLARALVKDAALADDVAQEAWLAAAGKVPADRPVRPWLSRVVRNVVRMRVRSTRRRAGYEAATEAGDSGPRPDDLLARVELQQFLATEVLALEEPYRSTVLLHYFEGLTSAEIARRLGIPDVTVRRRLQIALTRLRTRLDQDRGKACRAWLAPMAGLARHRNPLQLGRAQLATPALICTLLAALLMVWLRRDTGAGSDERERAF